MIDQGLANPEGVTLESVEVREVVEPRRPCRSGSRRREH